MGLVLLLMVMRLELAGCGVWRGGDGRFPESDGHERRVYRRGLKQCLYSVVSLYQNTFGNGIHVPVFSPVEISGFPDIVHRPSNDARS